MSRFAWTLPRGRILALAAFLSLLLSTACLAELFSGGYDRTDGAMRMPGGMMSGGRMPDGMMSGGMMPGGAMMPGGMMPGGKFGGWMSYEELEWGGGWVEPYDGAQGIHVSGAGAAAGLPDLAIIGLGVEALADTAGEARTAAADAMSMLLEALDDAEIADADIQTQYFNISPRYRSRQTGDEWESVLVGYAVTNRVSVKVRDLDDVGMVIDAAAVAAGDLVRVDGISFAIEDDAKLRDAAQAAAVEDMQRNAERLAELAGVKLGRLVFLSEADYYPPPGYDRSVALGVEAASALTPIVAGNLEVNASIQGVYLIAGADKGER